MTPQEMIRANAELVVSQLGPASGLEEFGYNAESVEWLDGFIERQRVRPEFAEAEDIERITQTLGSFLGECVVRCHGGEWREQEGSWAVDFGGGNSAFPFNKVRKQFMHGEGDSVKSWFHTIPLIFAGQLEAPVESDESPAEVPDESPDESPAEAAGRPAKKRPWWKFGR